MLTIFACPKPFTDPHIAIIQRNAITSWTLLRPKPEIILFGDEPGTSEICQELGLRHVPEIARNEFGTPLVSDIFEKAQQLATYDILCYVNADIILMSDFMRAVEKCSNFHRMWLLTGRRWLVDLTTIISFQTGWEDNLRQCAFQLGRLDQSDGTDWFAFPRNCFLQMPPMALGRGWWHAWLIWYVIHQRRGCVIDATEDVLAIHQNHPLGYLVAYNYDYEEKVNAQLCGGWVNYYSVDQAEFALVEGCLRRRMTRAKVVLEPWRRKLIIWTRPLRHVLGLRKKIPEAK